MEDFLSANGSLTQYGLESLGRWAQQNGHDAEAFAPGAGDKTQDKHSSGVNTTTSTAIHRRSGLPVVAVFGVPSTKSHSPGIFLNSRNANGGGSNSNNKRKDAGAPTPLVLSCQGPITSFLEAVVFYSASHVVLYYASDDELIRTLSHQEGAGAVASAGGLDSVISPQRYGGHQNDTTSLVVAGGQVPTSSAKLLCDNPSGGASNTQITIVVDNTLIQNSSTVTVAVKERYPTARLIRLPKAQPSSDFHASPHHHSSHLHPAHHTPSAAFEALLADLVESSSVKRLRPELPPLSPGQWYKMMMTLIEHGHTKTHAACLRVVVEQEVTEASDKVEESYQSKIEGTFGSSASGTGKGGYSTKALLAHHNEVKSEVLCGFRHRLGPFGPVDCEEVVGKLQARLQTVKHRLKVAAQIKAEAVITELLEPLSRLLLRGAGDGVSSGLDDTTLATWQEAIVDIIRRYHEELGGGATENSTTAAATSAVADLGIDASVRNSVLLDVMLQWYVPNTTVVHNTAQERVLASNHKLQAQVKELQQRVEGYDHALTSTRSQLESESVTKGALHFEAEKLTNSTLRRIETLTSSVETAQNVVSTALMTIVADKFQEASSHNTSRSHNTSLTAVPGGGADYQSAHLVSSQRHQVLVETEQHLREMLSNCHQLRASFSDSQSKVSNLVAASGNGNTSTGSLNGHGVKLLGSGRPGSSSSQYLVNTPGAGPRSSPRRSGAMGRPGMQATEESSLIKDGTVEEEQGAFWRSDAQLTGVALQGLGSGAGHHQDVMALKDLLFAAEQSKESAVKRAAEAVAAQASLEDQLAETRLRLRDLEADNLTLKYRYEELHTQYEAAEEHLHELRGVKELLGTTQGELVETKSREAAIASALSSTEQERDELIDVKSALKETTEQLEQVSQAHNENVDALAASERNLRDSRATSDSLAAEGRLLSADLQNARQITRQFEESQHTCSDLLAQMKQERQERDEGNQRYETQISDLLQIKDATVSDCSLLHDEVGSLKSLVLNLKEEVRSKADTNERLQKEVLLGKTELQQVNEQLSNKAGQLAQRESESNLLRMQASQSAETATSWRNRYDSLQHELLASREHEVTLRQHSDKLQSRIQEQKHIHDIAPNVVRSPRGGRHASPARGVGLTAHSVNMASGSMGAGDSATHRYPGGGGVNPGGYTPQSHTLSVLHSAPSLSLPPQQQHYSPLKLKTVHTAPSATSSGGRLQARPIDPHVRAIDDLASNVSKIRSHSQNDHSGSVQRSLSATGPPQGGTAPVTLGELNNTSGGFNNSVF